MARNATDYTGDNTGDPASTNDGGSESSFDTSALEAKLADQFDAAFDGVTDADVAADAAENPEPEPQQSERNRQVKAVNKKQQAQELLEEGLVSENEPDGVTEGEAAEGEETGQAEGEASETPAGTKPAEKSAIDPFHKWAAIEAGWTPEQISRLEKADPELAAQTFRGVADSYVALSRQAIGQVVPGVNAGNPPSQQDAFPTPKIDKFIAGLSEFAENNGEDLAGFVKALNEEIVQPYKALLAGQKVAEQRAHADEANTTFAAVSKEFPDFYGKDTARNPVQGERVQALAKLADQIRAGAKLQGKNVSIADCVKQAHAVLTSDLRVANARKAVVSQVQKRSNNITARPTQKSTGYRGGPPSVAKAIAAFELKAAELGFASDGEL